MVRGIILVGDRTSHDGVVITGSEIDVIDGRPIARLGDLVDCPVRYPGGVPHGINRIIEADVTTMLNGRPIALEGHRTECGCTLIASGHGSIG
ncbi:PAAR domain-containing protein [Variovorax humicola]|uniref:PAAR domain-containing protein n=1 Tax=Variovorax humicola TaxID=1769758 RepID=A0ABU8W2G6_9BURK